MNSTDFTGIESQVTAYIGLALSCLVTCGSLLTIVTILRSSALHETQYIFIVSLAIMDIILALTCTSVATLYQPLIEAHIDGCVLSIISDGVSIASVTMIGVHMSIIAIDRYIRIAHPFYYINKMTRQRIIQTLFFVWILWILVACIPLIKILNTPLLECNYTFQLPQFFSVTSIILTSVGIVCVCYGKIARLAISHKKAAIARRLQTGARRGTTDLRTNNITMKSIRFFVAMFGVYCLCSVVPFIVSGFTFLYDIPVVFTSILWYMFPVHSFLNFILLYVMDQRFKKAMKTIMSTSECPRVSCCLRVCRN